MQSVEYSLFRVKFINPMQKDFFVKNISSSEWLKIIINSKPSCNLKKNYYWHLGNVNFFSDDSGYFAVGRTTVSSIEKFDKETRNFTEEEAESSPYTFCVFNTSLGLIGIAKKSNLSAKVQDIANRLEQLFSSVSSIIENKVTVEVRPIPDPESFVFAIKNAYKIFRFSATFRGPNPFDADEYFQKPLSVYLSAAKGIQGKAIISGEDLDREVLIEVVKSTAATGNEASARIQKNPKQRATTINLKGDPIKRKFNEDITLETILLDLEDQCNKVRHNDKRD